MAKKVFKDSMAPCYEIVIGEDDNTGIRLVSLVESPAIEIEGMAFSKDKVIDIQNFEFKNIEDKQMVVGPALIPNVRIPREDENGDKYFVVFSAETIKTMVEKFNKGNNNKSINLDHTTTMLDAYIQQNWIVDDTFYDKSKLYGFNLPIGTWFIEVKMNSKEQWNEYVKNGSRRSFSVEGLMGQSITNKFNSIYNYKKALQFVEPTKGERQADFLPRCISYVINEGKSNEQAVAICNSMWEQHFASEKVSFDYDDTLSTSRGKDLAKKAIDKGEDVYIISARGNKEGMLSVATELGIESSKVYATGSNKAKVEKIKELGISKHYDNNADVIKELGSKGEKFMQQNFSVGGIYTHDDCKCKIVNGEWITNGADTCGMCLKAQSDYNLRQFNALVDSLSYNETIELFNNLFNK